MYQGQISIVCVLLYRSVLVFFCCFFFFKHIFYIILFFYFGIRAPQKSARCSEPRPMWSPGPKLWVAIHDGCVTFRTWASMARTPPVVHVHTTFHFPISATAAHISPAKSNQRAKKPAVARFVSVN